MHALPVSRRVAPVELCWSDEADVVVVGGGAAGLSAALSAAAGGRQVLVVTKGPLGDGATGWAQGGLAVVSGADDSLEMHVEDTLVAGAGLADPLHVRRLVEQAPRALATLRALGARFDLGGDGAYELGREGGHRRHRIVHAGGDATGAEVSRTLVAATRAAVATGRLRLLSGALALDADLGASGRVAGVRLLDARGPGLVSCRALVLATGGLGQAYASTSNPAGATGDGVALALRAGATVTDLEFVQFHPTLLHPQRPGPHPVLVSEAVRGEGAVLIDAAGRRVMAGLHPLADLAPRDVVSAGMHAHLRRHGGDHLLLDGTALGRARWEHRFPSILAACRAHGIDPVTEPVPVAPAAHYSCGGVLATLEGATDVPGLYAVGEVAATGVHGANRLASNSLTEGLVAGRLTGDAVVASLGARTAADRDGESPQLVDPAGREQSAELTGRLAGVLRDPADLVRLLAHLAAGAPTPAQPTVAAVEATNLHTVTTALAAAALLRAESRGAHRRTDADGPSAAWAHHLHTRLDPATGALLVRPETASAAA